MGILTDIVVADRTKAKEVCESECPSREFAGLDIKGIDTTKLGLLHAILTGGKHDPRFMSDVLYARHEEGPWVIEVPPDLVNRLAALNPEEIEATGKTWAATEEFSPKYDNWPAEAVQQCLQKLVELSTRAVADGKSVLLWMAL